jgi:hypothetical protein
VIVELGCGVISLNQTAESLMNRGEHCNLRAKHRRHSVVVRAKVAVIQLPPPSDT